MDLDAHTTSLLTQLEQLARRPLARRHDVGLILELARRRHLDRTLDELAFYAKFCHKTYRIMQRIGKEAEGYARLAEEFGAHVTRCRNLLEDILTDAPDDIRRHFTEEVLAMNPTAFSNLLHLFHDLSWLKNREIDQRTKAE
jgi:hypothetical protein